MGWLSLPISKTKPLKSSPFISIIIAVKNEEENIAILIDSLTKQKYHHNNFEIIFVNDYSTDNTENVIHAFIHKYNDFRIMLLSNDSGNKGKKHALKKGIDASKGELIITIDADCIMKPNWMESIASFYIEHKPDMIIGPVCIKAEESLFSKLQSLEFLSLVGVTGGSAAIKNPIMANGANLAFKKITYEELGGYKIGMKYKSGDDMFFLQQIKKQKDKRVMFLKNTDAVVFTKAKGSLTSFLMQRIRWAGKSAGYKDFYTQITALTVFLTNLIIIAGLSLYIAGFRLLGYPLLIIFVVKILIDFPIIASVSNFYRNKKLLWHYPLVAVIYPFYVFSVVFFSIFIKNNWK